MLKHFFRQNGKLLFVLLGLSIFASLTSLPYLRRVTVLPPELNSSLDSMLLLSVVNFTINSVLAILVGLTFGRRVGLGAPLLSAWLSGSKLPEGNLGRSLLGAVVIGVVAVGLTLLADLPFLPHLPEVLASAQNPNTDIVPFWAGLLTMFQGGINEELWMRFGVMSFVVWLLSAIFARRSASKPAWVYIAAILFAAILFGVGHLTAAPVMFAEVTAVLVVRIVVVNSIVGVFFGYLYWKKGLEHAIVAHMVGDIVLHAFIGL